MQTLLVHRAGVLFDGDWLGAVLALPAPPAVDTVEPLGETVADDDVLAACLGLDRELVQFSGVTELRCFGLHDPSPWEERLLVWIAARLGVDLPATPPLPNGPFSALAAQLADPLAPWDSPPAGVELLHGEDVDLEALGATRWLRRNLLAVADAEWGSWLEGVVILLPDDDARLATWRHTLESAGLPVRSRTWRNLADTAVGKWALALARLGGQGRFRRDDLLTALLSPFFRVAPGTVRADLRNVLRTVRRPTLTFDMLARHAAAWFGRVRRTLERRDGLEDEDRASEIADLAARETGLLATLASVHRFSSDARSPLSSMRALFAENLQAMLRAAGQREEADATHLLVEVIGELAQTELTADGVHRALHEACSARGRGTRSRPERGVRLTTWTTWDGRGGHHVILAGLEEGGWPATVPTPTRREQALAEVLRLGTPADARSRQGRVARRALASASEAALLTWSDRDSRGSDTFPGAFLMGRLCPEDASRRDAWAARVTHVCERDILPRTPMDSFLPDELRLWPPPADGADAGWQEVELQRRAARELQRARAPRSAGTPPGPWSGDVGAPPADQAWSATSLEMLGQCGAKFFHTRLLGAARVEDAETLLDTMESGTLVHDALAESALPAIRSGRAWQLQAPHGDTLETHVEARLTEVTRALNDGVERSLTEQPTLGNGITGATGMRWQRILGRYLRTQAKTERPTPLALDDVDLGNPLEEQALHRVRQRGAATDEVDAREAVERKWTSTLQVLEALRTSPKRTEKEAEAICRRYASHFVTQKAAKRAMGSDAEFDAVRRDVELACTTARAKADENLRTRLAKLRHDGDAVPLDVVAAEWAFGMTTRHDGPSDPASVTTPLAIPVEGAAPLLVKGRIDRVDADLARRRFRVVDYKTGAKVNDPSRAFGAGLHLQLPLYAHAVQTLLAPQWPGDAPITAVAGQLSPPRQGADKAMNFEEARWTETTDEDAAAPDAPAAADVHTVLTRHLRVSAGRLRSGMFPLAPRACPLRDAGAHCDLARSCGFLPEAAPLDVKVTPPTFVPPHRAAKDAKDAKALNAPGMPVRLDPPKPPPSAADAYAHAQIADAIVDDLDHDVVVSAGAGSGKTTRLVRRYVHAIASGVPPEQILAITFTRKATAEMRVRVREALVREAPALSEAARRAALLALGSAPILTIDAFAAHVVRCLAPDRASAISDSASAFQAGWVEGRLVEACDAPSPELEVLLDALPVAKIRDLLTAWVDLDPQRVTALAERSVKDLTDAWLRAFERAFPELATDADALMAILPEVTAAQSTPGLAQPDADQLASLATWLERLSDLRRGFGSLGALAGFTRPGTTAVTRPVSKPFVEVAQQIYTRWSAGKHATDNLRKALAATCKDSTDPVDTLRNALRQEAERTRAALQLAASWQTELADARAARGLVVHGDVQRLATDLLRQAVREAPLAAEVRAQLGYMHLFVDEFQDTSRGQVELFDALAAALATTGPAPVRFYVGDLKQSIYRFRGAEVDVFAQESQTSGRRLTSLDACWRARPSLTRAIDRLFERVLAPHAERRPTDPLAGVTWEPLAPRWDADGQEEADDAMPPFELLGALVREESANGLEPADDETEETDDADGDVTTDADASDTSIVDRIREIRAEHPSWTIAVLVHGWELAGRWGDALRAAGIPAYVQGGKGLLSDPVVDPLLAVLDALEREDDLGVWEVLHGPLVGVSDVGLWAIRNGAGVTLTSTAANAAPTGKLPLRQLRFGFSFDDEAATSWLEAARGSALPAGHREALRQDAARILRWRAWWDTARRTLGLAPATAWLDSLLAATGYAAQLADAPIDVARVRLTALRRFRGLLGDVAEAATGGGSLVRELRRRREEEDDPSSASNPYEGQAVTVTVVHQAKGLAWDVVVLPNPDKATLKGHRDLGTVARVLEAGDIAVDLAATKRTDTTDLFATAASLSSDIVALASAPWERAELRRLLYVACTRARQRVVLGGLPTRPTVLARLMTTWTQRAEGAPSHRHARNWRDDLLLGLGVTCEVENGVARWALHDDAWVEGRDYRWVLPRPHPANALQQADAVVWPHDLERRLHRIPSSALEVLNPSAAKGANVPTPLEDPAPGAQGASTPHPFPNARVAGTVAHRAFATWAWRAEPSEGLLRAAIADTLPAGWLARHDLARATAWVHEVLLAAEAGQPALASRLREAARRGDVRHETRVQILLDGRRIEGSIDLMWRDERGAWHLLDYKATESNEEDGGAGSLDARIRNYFPQVATYARAVRAALPPGERLATFGLWFVREGRLVRWPAMAEDTP